MQAVFDPGAFRRDVLAYVRRHDLLRPGDRAAIAVSGGADSVALLRVMLELRRELGVVLSVAHFNHKIRAEASEGDEVFVRNLARCHGVEFHCSSADAPAYAHAQRLSLETAARELRYRFFRELIGSGAVSKVMTAHSLEDQAETVLMRIIRGTGTSGLAGIYPQVAVKCENAGASGSASHEGMIVRPFLGTRRCEIESYLRALGQDWQEDATNSDLHHARNRVRHVLLPLLETEFNPAARQRLAELADIARVEEEQWDQMLGQHEVRRDATTLDAEAMASLPVALQRRIIRRLAEELSIQVDFETTDAIQRMSTEGACLQLPGGWRVRRERLRRVSGGTSGVLLHFEACSDSRSSSGYEYMLEWPGELRVPEAGLSLSVRVQTRAGELMLLDPQKLAPKIMVRNWRPGDRFWPAHTSGPKKVKELLQKQHITGSERETWPVAVSGGEIVWMQGFPVSEKYRATAGSGLLIGVQPYRALDE